MTLKEGNFAQLAHIVAFQSGGPRGQGKRPRAINDASNLMVLCPSCHKLIDDNPALYTRRTLEDYKNRHETHIRHVTGLRPDLKTSILVFTANIGKQNVFIPFDQMLEAVSPRYPVSRPGTVIDLTQIHVDGRPSFETASETIRRRMDRLYDAESEAQTVKHLSVFALAPIPLLVDLGARLSNKIPTDLFQRHRDTEDWTWKRKGKPVEYEFRRLQTGGDPQKVAIILSLSGPIRSADLPREIDRTFSIYEFTLKGQAPVVTFLKTKRDLENFRGAYQMVLSTLMRDHPTLKHLHFFPAVPAPIAILCGRELLPKVHPELLIYDFDKQKVGFTFQLKVN